MTDKDYQCDGQHASPVFLFKQEVTEVHAAFNRIGHASEGTLDVELHFCPACVANLTAILSEDARQLFIESQMAARKEVTEDD